MPVTTVRKAAKQRCAIHHLAEYRRPIGLERAIRLRQDEPIDQCHYASPRLLTRPTFWGGVATAVDFLDVLSDYDANPPTVEEQEAEIERYFADAFVHFGRAFSCVAANIGHLTPPK